MGCGRLRPAQIEVCRLAEIGECVRRIRLDQRRQDAGIAGDGYLERSPPLPDRPAAYRVVIDCGVSDVPPPGGAQHLNGLAQDFCVTFASGQIERGFALSRAFGPGEHPAICGNVIGRQPERLIEVGDSGGALAHLEQCFSA